MSTYIWFHSKSISKILHHYVNKSIMTDHYIGVRWVVVCRSFRKKQNIHEEKDLV